MDRALENELFLQQNRNSKYCKNHIINDSSNYPIMVLFGIIGPFIRVDYTSTCEGSVYCLRIFKNVEKLFLCFVNNVIPAVFFSSFSSIYSYIS